MTQNKEETIASVPSVLGLAQSSSEYCLDITKELRQSEIISGLTRIIVTSKEENDEDLDLSKVAVNYCIVLTPDCDLLNDFRSGGRTQKIMEVLLYPMYPPEKIRENLSFSSNQMKLIQQNRVEQCHYFGAISAERDLQKLGLPDLVIDFKRYFTLPAIEIYRQTRLPGNDRALRRCRLGDLWREALQRRAMSYMQRVALPDPADGE